MPLTFLAHQAIVIPLKMAAPRRVSGTALVLGSAAPDVEYVIRTWPVSQVSHTWLGQLTFCLPVTLALYLIVTRIVARPVAANLPAGNGFAWGDYALLSEQPRGAGHWAVVAASALLGSASHVIVDRAEQHAVALAVGDTTWRVGQPLPIGAVATTVQVAVSVVLVVAGAALFRRIGRRRLIRAWQVAGGGWGEARSGKRREAAGRGKRQVARSPARFWTPVALVAVASGIAGAIFRRPAFYMHEPATWVHIALASVAGAFVALVAVSILWPSIAVQSDGTRNRSRLT